MTGQLAFVYLALRDLAEPLLRRVSSPEALENLFYRYGWNAGLDDSAFGKASRILRAKEEIEEFLAMAGPLRTRLDQSPDANLTTEEVIALAEAADALIEALTAFDDASLAELLEPLNSRDFWNSIVEHLLDDLLEEYLRVYHSGLYAVLRLWGVIRYEPTVPAGKFRVPYTRIQLDWQQLGALAKDPAAALKQTYRWGDPAAPFEHGRLFDALGDVLDALHVRTSRFAPGAQSASALPVPMQRVPEAADTLRAVLSYGYSPRHQAAHEVGLDLTPVTKTGEPFASGLLLNPLLRGGAEREMSIGRELALRWKGAVDASHVAGIVVFPDDTEPVSGQAALSTSVEIAGTGSEPYYLLGNARTARLELSQPFVRLSVEGTAGDPEAILHAGARGANGQPGCKVVLPFDDADEFVKDTVAQNGLELSFTPDVVFSSKTGLAFNGRPSVDIDIPIGKSVGRVRIQHLLVRAHSTGTDADPVVELEASAGIDATIGPVLATVDRIGVEMTLDFARPERNLGFADLAVGFKPPSGIGVAIESTGVSGGGYLFFDREKGQYAGVVRLNVEGGITLTAIGLIATRLPDGSKGFSFLVLITAEDFKPIPLGLGFTLNAVGGLLALNRTCNEEFLREGIKSNTLGALLFPTDPIRNAMQIFGTLNTAFPPQRGSHLFGPVVRICWGTPPVVTMDLGLILELGNRTRLVILGRALAILPSEKHDLIRLQMNALGVIDFDQRTASLDAVLYDSRLVGKFPITGSMAMRLNWGSAPQFALSVGGFHPAFRPPAKFPVLQRLAVSFSDSADFRLRSECYFALTSNTLQFGSRMELFARAAGFSIEGFVGYDVLIQFDPFAFAAGYYASLQLKRGSRNLFKVKVEGELSGPKPLHIRGKASFEILWCDFSVRFDKTLVAGDPPPRLPPVDVKERLIAALREPRNWSGQLGDGARRIVSIRERQTADAIALHPLGRVSVTQTVVPLDLRIARFGNATPAGERVFRISSVSVSGTAVGFEQVKDFFAPSQFLELSDEEKLSAPSFESMNAGVTVGVASIVMPPDEEVLEDEAIRYETLVIDTTRVQAPKPAVVSLTPDALDKQLGLGAAARADVRRSGSDRFRAAGSRYAMAKKGWTIVATTDGAPRAVANLEAGQITTYAEAFAAVETVRRENPQAAKRLMLVRVAVTD